MFCVLCCFAKGAPESPRESLYTNYLSSSILLPRRNLAKQFSVEVINFPC